ncbi:Crp/Fnr family transcriptional regulator [Chitinophaga sancti]|uniref:Crp/Fnr family transcriptional regulator n=1 Tax=Chitinophaga sancti TaxID=1004 RepID=A0A1K1P5H0_9BACT|nr:Crp/Fnr family transcriptional regulator [Chitinophaga sancti]WQD60477.1 Crp/Fnr family transcriptional regulator [Chitinophaga sancti]WQG87395.1 Crp/Fnr family transcriptional regulator [Chitinophaga sancti]SFW42737.1 cAMP-binding domain of CRP or a regulatory subunit of cAMP-dependent protein kinases [Chitinophaga sancti]
MSTLSLQNFLQKNTLLNEEESEKVASAFKLIKVGRNEMIEREGDICGHFYFIHRGCLRLYEIDKKGNEITAYFAFENSFITSITSLITQKPSRDILISHEPSELMVIDKVSFFNLTERYPPFKLFYNKTIEFAFIHAQMRIYSFLGMDGIDKLKWVLEHEPMLLTRISSKAVASYLGMTNSTLSKLKAKL